MAKENDGQITLTKEELNLMLEEAAKRGAQESQKVTECDEEDVHALEFIRSFEPDGLEPLGIFSKRSIPGRMIGYVLSRKPMRDLQKKISEFNAFEAHLKPYYDYADDPEGMREDLDQTEYNRYCFKHDIYRRLHEEKLRRFGLFGFHRGIVDLKILD